jgi:hypothetical protein
VTTGNQKSKTREWKEIYSAKPWFTPDVEDSDEDTILSVWTPGERTLGHARCCTGAVAAVGTSSPARRWGGWFIVNHALSLTSAT